MDLSNISAMERALPTLSDLEYDRIKLTELRDFKKQEPPLPYTMMEEYTPMLCIARHGYSIVNYLELTDEELREVVGILYERKVKEIDQKIAQIKEIIKTL